MKQYKKDLARTMTQEMDKMLKETRGDVQEGMTAPLIQGALGSLGGLENASQRCIIASMRVKHLLEQKG